MTRRMMIEKQMRTVIKSVFISGMKKGVDAMHDSTRPLPESSMTLTRRNRADYLRREMFGFLKGNPCLVLGG